MRGRWGGGLERVEEAKGDGGGVRGEALDSEESCVKRGRRCVVRYVKAWRVSWRGVGKGWFR